MKNKTLSYLFCVCISISSFAQTKTTPIVLKLNPVKGSKFTFRLTNSSETEMKMMGQSTNSTNNTSSDIQFEYLGDSAGLQKFNATTLKIAVEMDMMGNSMKINTDEPQNASGMESDNMLKLYTAIINKSYVITINTKGEIIAANGAQEILESAKKTIGETSVGAGLKKMLSPKILTQGFTQLFNVYPIKPVGIGDKWSSKASTDMNGMVMDTKNTFTLDKVEANTVEIKIKANSDFEGSPESLPDGARISMNGTTTGKLALEITTGLISSMITDGFIDAKINMQGQDMPMRITTKSSITQLKN